MKALMSVKRSTHDQSHAKIYESGGMHWEDLGVDAKYAGTPPKAALDCPNVEPKALAVCAPNAGPCIFLREIVDSR